MPSERTSPYRRRVDILNELIMQTIASPWLLVVLFAVTVVDGFFPPVPSETVLVAAAAVAATHGDHAMLMMLCAVGAAAAAIGDNIAFAVGRSVGVERFGWMRRPRVQRAFDDARQALETRSASLILGARYIPVGRVAVNMSAGALGFPWRRFVPLSMVGAMAWSVLSIVIGLFAGSWITDQPLVSAAVGVSIALAVGFVIDRVAAARRHREDVPHLAG